MPVIDLENRAMNFQPGGLELTSVAGRNAQRGLTLEPMPKKQFLNGQLILKETDYLKKQKNYAMNINELNETIKNHYKNDYSGIIKDGIINPDEYKKASIKILWVLKEGYKMEDKDDWDSCKEMNDDVAEYFKIPTWKTVAFTSYCILKKKKYEEIKSSISGTEIAAALKSIAYINIKKIPGKTQSKAADIDAAYKKDKEIVLKQIKTFKPDIIIGGNTMYLIAPDLGLNYQNESLITYSDCVWEHASQLYIQAQHPSQIGNKEEYCSDIINAVREWQNKNKF